VPKETSKPEFMPNTKILKMPFAKVYPLYITKVEKKSRTKAEVDKVIMWLTGYSFDELNQIIEDQTDFETFFANAPKMNPNCYLITGVICGWRVEDIEEGLMKNIRYMDKLIDELAKGKKMDKILRK
jgi:hypothetical protein